VINRIIDWCAGNRFLMFTGTVVLTLWGVWAMTATPLDAVPDISDVHHESARAAAGSAHGVQHGGARIMREGMR